MNHYDNKDDREARGIDFALEECLDYHPQDEFDLAAIEQVLAVREGERDGEFWYWVLRLRDGRYAALSGWCDYTGWDCRSGAESSLHATALGAALSVDDNEVRGILIAQIFNGKDQTWREQKDAEFGLGGRPS